MMILDKDGCSAVDLFLVFLQISGENPKILVCRSKRFQMIWDDFRQRWLLCCLFPVFLQISGVTWQMSLSLAPIISRGQGMELKSLPEPFRT